MLRLIGPTSGVSVRIAFLVIILPLCPRSISAAVVGEVTDPVDSQTVGEGEFRTFPFGGWITDDTVTASDGNKVLAITLPNKTTTGDGDGYVWHLSPSAYADALGTEDPLQNGWVVRQSAWLAMSPNDPLLNEGVWSDSLKFEFANTHGGFKYLDTGNILPVDFTPNQCDIALATCSNAGSDFQISTMEWTQVWMQYEIDDFDFSGGSFVSLEESVASIAPVLFVGNFGNDGDQKQGTLFIDNIVIEVFEDLATANSSALPSNEPGGIPDGNFLAGDFNEDDLVDGLDFLAWQRGESPDPLSAADLADWEANYEGQSISAVFVPEPSSACALVFVIGMLLQVRVSR